MSRLFCPAVEPQTQTFTATTTWTAPMTLAALDVLTGKGGTGTPAGTGTTYVTYREDTKITLYRYPDGTSKAVGPTLVSSKVWDGKPLPGDYCDPEYPYTSITEMPPEGTTSQTCYYAKLVQKRITYNNPATTGAATTGFGKSFPGGTGGAATPVTYTNVALTPGEKYNLSIPSGGSITIAYLA